MKHGRWMVLAILLGGGNWAGACSAGSEPFPETAGETEDSVGVAEVTELLRSAEDGKREADGERRDLGDLIERCEEMCGDPPAEDPEVDCERCARVSERATQIEEARACLEAARECIEDVRACVAEADDREACRDQASDCREEIRACRELLPRRREKAKRDRERTRPRRGDDAGVGDEEAGEDP